MFPAFPCRWPLKRVNLTRGRASRSGHSADFLPRPAGQRPPAVCCCSPLEKRATETEENRRSRARPRGGPCTSCAGHGGRSRARSAAGATDHGGGGNGLGREVGLPRRPSYRLGRAQGSPAGDAARAEEVFYAPEVPDYLQPLVAVVPL